LNPTPPSQQSPHECFSFDEVAVTGHVPS
jgi:hypothetical protein